MTVLAVGDRGLAAQRFGNGIRPGDALAVTKPDIQAAVNAVDQWIEDNAASFNAALPLPARTALNARQKARLLVEVVRRRFEVA